MKLLLWTLTALNSKLNYDFYSISLKITLRWVILLFLDQSSYLFQLTECGCFHKWRAVLLHCPVHSCYLSSGKFTHTCVIRIFAKKRHWLKKKLFTAFTIAVIWDRTIPFLKNEMHWERKDAALTSHVVMNRIEAWLVGTRVHRVIRTSVGGVRERSISYIIIRTDAASLWERSIKDRNVFNFLFCCLSVSLFVLFVGQFLPQKRGKAPNSDRSG